MTLGKKVSYHLEIFRSLTKQALEDMFNCEAKIYPGETTSKAEDFVSDLPFSVRIHFTGLGGGQLTSGEYILATDERVAGAVCAIISETATSAEVEACRGVFSDAFSELLNGVVGETVLDLDSLESLKFSTPRVSYGKMSYGRLQIHKADLATPAGRIECLFYCDPALED